MSAIWPASALEGGEERSKTGAKLFADGHQLLVLLGGRYLEQMIGAGGFASVVGGFGCGLGGGFTGVIGGFGCGLGGCDRAVGAIVGALPPCLRFST